MAKKAEAYKEYREAAMIEMLLDTLPKVNKFLKYYVNFFKYFLFFFRLLPKLQPHYRKLKRSQWFHQEIAK